jgi:hypothetical protein
MRGVVKLVTGLVFISIATVFMGPVLEPIADIVANNAAVQSLGFDDSVLDIRDTILRYVPLLFIAVLLAFAGAVAFDTGRVSEVRRR